MWVPSLGQGEPLEEEMAPHSSIEVGWLEPLDQESLWWRGRVFKDLNWASTLRSSPIREWLDCSQHLMSAPWTPQGQAAWCWNL